MQSKWLRHRSTTPITALRTTQRQIRPKIYHFILKDPLTIRAHVQVRQESFELQQFYFKVTQHCVEIFRRLRGRLETCERHPKEIVIRLVWWRKIDEQVAHVSEAREHRRIRRKVKA